MTPALSQQRCVTHPAREAVGRCPACRRFFCRECLTDFHARLLCSSCIAEQTLAVSRDGTARNWWNALRKPALFATALFLAWSFFLLAGVILAGLAPRSSH